MSDSFQNHFLVALSGLSADYFQNSLSLIVDHDEKGAFGLMINRPLEQDLSAVFPDLPDHVVCTLYEGGPVEQDKLFFLHDRMSTFESTFELGPDVGLTTSRDIVDQLHDGHAPKHLMAILGYAGWGPQQLENELSEDTWLITPAHTDIIFTLPVEQRAKAAAKQLGIDLNLIGPLGHD